MLDFSDCIELLHGCSTCSRKEGEPTYIGGVVHGLVWVQHLLQYVSLALQYAHIVAMQSGLHLEVVQIQQASPEGLSLPGYMYHYSGSYCVSAMLRMQLV